MALAIPSTLLLNGASLIAPVIASKGSLNTKIAYEADLRAYMTFTDAFQGDSLLRIPSPRICAWRDAMLDDGLSRETVARRLAAVRGFYRYHVATGAIQRNPADPLLVTPPSVSSVSTTVGLTQDEARALLTAPDNDRDRAILGLMLYHGLRRQEVADLWTTSIYEDQGVYVLVILGKGVKERKAPLHPDVWAKIKEYLTLTKGSIHVRRSLFQLSSAGVWVVVKKWVRIAGIKKKISPHSLRHTCCTRALHLTNGNLNEVAKLMGHQSPRTTMRYDLDRENLTNHLALTMSY